MASEQEPLFIFFLNFMNMEDLGLILSICWPFVHPTRVLISHPPIVTPLNFLSAIFTSASCFNFCHARQIITFLQAWSLSISLGVFHHLFPSMCPHPFAQSGHYGGWIRQRGGGGEEEGERLLKDNCLMLLCLLTRILWGEVPKACCLLIQGFRLIVCPENWKKMQFYQIDQYKVLD